MNLQQLQQQRQEEVISSYDECESRYCNHETSESHFVILKDELEKDHAASVLAGYLLALEEVESFCIQELVPIHRQLKTETNREVREYLIGKRNQIHDIQIHLATIKAQAEGNSKPHYEVRGDKPVWITYKDGEEVIEPYNHQDGQFANLCAYPTYCRCSE